MSSRNRFHLSFKVIAFITFANIINQAWAGDLTVDARCNIYGAGHGFPNNTPDVGPNGGGLPPVLISLAALSNAPALQFNVSGLVSYCPTCGTNEADGANFVSDSPGYNGISGISNAPGRSLMGVFTTEIEPSDPPPAALNFAGTGTNYLFLSPQLRQMFFIGDGLTAAGIRQTVRVPPGATRLYLGLVDGFSYADTPDGYDDNTGSLSVDVTPALWLTIDRSTGQPGISVFGLLNSTNRVEYTPILPPTNWMALTNVVLTNIPAQFFDNTASEDRNRFYRAKQLP